MTDNTQELDEILAAVHLAGISNGLHRDITDPEEIKHRREGFIKANPVCKDAKQAILDWHNKQMEALLDRLESKGLNEDGGSRYVTTPDGYVAAMAWNEAQDRVERAIEAERIKLKEAK